MPNTHTDPPAPTFSDVLRELATVIDDNDLPGPMDITVMADDDLVVAVSGTDHPAWLALFGRAHKLRTSTNGAVVSHRSYGFLSRTEARVSVHALTGALSVEAKA